MALPVALRSYDPATDRDFVYKAWLSSYKRSDHAGMIPDHLYYPVYGAVVAWLLGRGMQINLAVSPDDRDQILGFIAYEPRVLHYAFVKDFVRRQGVASILLASANFSPASPLFCTFWTPDAKHLGKRVVHKPSLGRRKTDAQRQA